MTANNDEMAAWSAEWVSEDASTPKLGARMNKGRRLARLGRLVNMFAAIAVTVIGAMFAIMSPKLVTVTLMIFVVVVVWVNALYMWWVTRIGEESAPDDALSFMAAHRKLLQVRLRFLDAGKWGGGLIVGFIVAWLPWMIGSHLEFYLREPWRAIVGVGGVLLLLAFSFFMARRDRRDVMRELEELDRLEEELRGSLGSAEG